MAAATRTERLTRAEVHRGIEQGAVAALYGNGRGVFLPIDGRRKRLIQPDGTVTEAGRAYYDALGVPAPSLYSYEEPLVDNKWVRGFNGKMVQVRKWDKATSQWVPTPLGRDYFKHNKTEWVVMLPAKRVFEHSGRRHWIRTEVPLTDTEFGDYVTTPALNATGKFHGEGDEQALVKAAVEMWIATRPTDADHGLRVLVEKSDSAYLYFPEPNRQMEFIVRRTNVRNTGGSTVDYIMSRPLRGAVMLGEGVEAPWDLHEMALQDADGKCVPVMLYESCRERKKRRVNGAEEHYYAPLFKPEDIEASLDEIFAKRYKVHEYPYDAGDWRVQGCTADMVMDFCKGANDKELKIAVYVLHRNKLIRSYDPEEGKTKKTSNRPVVCFSVWWDHAYFYGPQNSGPGSMRNIVGSMKRPFGGDDDEPIPIRPGDATDVGNVVVLDNKCEELEKGIPPFSEWMELGDLSVLREMLHMEAEDTAKESRKRSRAKDSHESRCSDLTMWTYENLDSVAESVQELFGPTSVHIKKYYGSSPLEPVSLSLKTKPGKTQRNIRIKHVPDDAELLQAFCDNVGIDYYGEGIAAVTDNAFKAFLQHKKPQRRISAELRSAIVREQDRKCASCQLDFTANNYEIDHITPVAAGGSSERSNLQALCPECHRQKSADEASHEMRYCDVALQSVMSQDLLDGFVGAPKPKQRVHGSGAQGCSALDVIGCRRSALLMNKEPLPIFVLLDRIERYDPNVDYDFVWVDRGPAESTEDLPYTGPRWYWKAVVRVMLDWRLVRENHLLYSLRAGRHEDPQIIVDLFERISEAWAKTMPWEQEDVVVRKQKESLLALEGLWSRQRFYTFKVSDSPFDGDCPGASYAKLVGESSEKALCRKSHPTNQTMYPLALIALNMEQLYVALGARALRQIKVNCLGMKVDSVYFRAGPRKLALIKADVIGKLRHADTNEKIFQLQSDKTAPSCEQSVAPMNNPSPSFWIPDNFAEDDSVEIMQMPFGHWSSERRFCFERRWKRETEPDEPDDPINDPKGEKHLKRFVEISIENQGALWHGFGGTGKSWGSKLLVAALQQKGWTVRVVALTHVAAIIAEGGTLAHEFYASMQRKNFAVVIDECSVIPMGMWTRIARWQFLGARFYILGDFGQLPPIGTTGDELERFEQSDFLHSLVRGLRCDFRMYRRGKDGRHFRFVRDLYSPTGELQDCIAKARLEYPAKTQNEVCDEAVSLVVSHKKRVAINAYVNDQLRWKHPDAVFVQCVSCAALDKLASTVSNLPQDMWVWPGMKLIGCVKDSDKQRIVNGAVYKVIEVDFDDVLVKRDDFEPFKVKHAEASRNLRLQHALCYFTVQGRTIDTLVRLDDTRHPYFSLRHLRVGLGRAPEGKDVEVL